MAKKFSALSYAHGSPQKSPVPLGNTNREKHSIALTDQHRSTYVVGTHGTGKSTFLLNSILSDIRANNKGVVVLDPHGDLAKDVLLRCPKDSADRVVYFSPNIGPQADRPLGLNPFQWSLVKEKDLKAGGILDTFTHLWYGSFDNAPTMQGTLNAVTRTLIDAYPHHPITAYSMFLLIRRDDVGDAARKYLSSFVDNVVTQYRWDLWSHRGQFISDTESSEKKISHILTSKPLLDILAQPINSKAFEFEKVLSDNGVIVVDLSGIEKESQKLLGSILMTQLVIMGKLREDRGTRTPCHIYADEFYNFAPESFVTIINEMRKYGLFCTVAHQTLAQLSDRARAAVGNCANKVFFQTNPTDADDLSKHFRIYEEKESFAKVLKEGTYGAMENKVTFDFIGQEIVTDYEFRNLPSHHLSNIPPYYALVKCARNGNPAEDYFLQMHPPQGTEDERIAEGIIRRSAGYGTPVNQVADIIEKENHFFSQMTSSTGSNKSTATKQTSSVSSKKPKKKPISNKKRKSDGSAPQRPNKEPKPNSGNKEEFWS